MTSLAILMILVIVLALAFDFLNGFHDAANSIATVVVAKTLTPLQAVILAGLANFIGYFTFGHAIAKMVSSGIINLDILPTPESKLLLLLGALLGAILWNIITWLFGLPERNKKINSNLVWSIAKSIMKNQPVSFPVNDYRGVTYVYELIEKMEGMFHLPGGIYNAGSENDLNVYELAKIVFKAMGLENRIEPLLLKEFRDKPRDLRISNQKLKANGIAFSSSEAAINKCMADFSFSVKLY